MQREIKYRGKRVDGNGWVVGDLMQHYIHHEGYLTIVEAGCIYYKVLPESVGQYTGLDDDEAIQIYEDDWCSAEFRTKDGIQVVQGRIIMDEYMWCIDCTGSTGDDIFSINRLHNFKIIGNTIDNPELIKP